MIGRTLISGAQGFMGRYIHDWIFCNRDDTVVLGLGRSPRSNETFTHKIQWRERTIPAPLPPELARSAINPRYDYVSIDLADALAIETVIREFKPTHVIHMASGLRGDNAEKLFRTNVEGTISLLEAIARSGVSVPRVLLGSSGGVYGAPRALPLHEGDLCEPMDLYATSKLASEHAANVVARSRNIPLIIARVFNLLGPGQDERHVAGRFASQLSMSDPNADRIRVSAGDLTPTRDFIDVRDAAAAVMLLAERGADGEPYNVATGIETSIAEILQMTYDASGRRGSLEIDQIASIPAGIFRQAGSISKLQSLGYEPKHVLKRSIVDLMTYYSVTVPAAAYSVG